MACLTLWVMRLWTLAATCERRKDPKGRATGVPFHGLGQLLPSFFKYLKVSSEQPSCRSADCKKRHFVSLDATSLTHWSQLTVCVYISSTIDGFVGHSSGIVDFVDAFTSARFDRFLQSGSGP